MNDTAELLVKISGRIDGDYRLAVTQGGEDFIVSEQRPADGSHGKPRKGLAVFHDRCWDDARMEAENYYGAVLAGDEPRPIQRKGPGCARCRKMRKV